MPELFVYGTLRGTGQPARLRGFTRVQGEMPYPTIKPDPDGVVDGELLQIPDANTYDRVEGCVPAAPERSFYWRFEVEPDTYVYVANPEHRVADWPVAYTYAEVEAAIADAHVETGLD